MANLTRAERYNRNFERIVETAKILNAKYDRVRAQCAALDITVPSIGDGEIFEEGALVAFYDDDGNVTLTY